MSRLALAGDTMLGRGVADHLSTHPVRSLFGNELLDILTDTDGMLLNLECCISDRGEPWPGRVFHFRAPPIAVDALTLLGVRCVTLANNHTLDYGVPALVDTLDHLHRAGISVVGAGADLDSARTPVRLAVGSAALTVVAFTDHPSEYAAGAQRPGVAYAEIPERTPGWVTDTVRRLSHTPVLVCPHWGPNMTRHPEAYVLRAARDLVRAGATLIAGHSAHVFHGVTGNVLYDLGDFVDDYATDPVLRNDLGVLWLVDLDAAGPTVVEAVPLHIGFCRTTVAHGDDAGWIQRRLRDACRALGTDVTECSGNLVIPLRNRHARPLAD